MSVWRQLRWRIVGAHMVVVVVGVTLVLLMAWLVTQVVVPDRVLASLLSLEAADETGEAAALVLNEFRRSILLMVAVAGLGALVAGMATSLLLAREILRPLNQIAYGSQRIARGHYGERVAVPPSDELAAVATSFNQMAEALQQVEAQRVLLIGNVSHELRTPLTGLNGYLEGLIDGLFPDDVETYALMAQEVRRLRRLVDDLQDLSRVEAGQIELHLASFDVVPLIQRIVMRLQPQAEAECLRIDVVHPEKTILVLADADRVAQVLLNLVGNAIRYTPQQGCVTVRVTAVSPHAIISVEDDGIGIPAEALPYLFERFYRVDSSRARHSGGSGIGLTISRHLVWAMGGELTAVSPGPNQGSTFTFTLPLAKAF